MTSKCCLHCLLGFFRFSTQENIIWKVVTGLKVSKFFSISALLFYSLVSYKKEEKSALCYDWVINK